MIIYAAVLDPWQPRFAVKVTEMVENMESIAKCHYNFFISHKPLRILLL